MKETLRYALIAFIAGFGVLVVEIAGARLISGTLGNSIYTWSALIAAVLVSLSFGNLAGGWLIDRSHRYGWLLGALGLSAFATALVPPLAAFASRHVTENALSLTGGALYVSAVVFILPSFAYGMVSPLCVKLLVSSREGKMVGTSAGVVSMAGSMGSFLGALATPFLLMPHLRLTSIFLLIAGLVLSSALLLWKPARLSTGGLGLLLAGAGAAFAGAYAERAAAPEPPYLWDENTAYHRIRVEERDAGARKARLLYLDTTLEGGLIEGETRLPLEYQNAWQLTRRFNLDVKRALCIGAGAFGVPQQLSKAFPNAVIDVAEIDPEVIATGERFFHLGDFPNVHAAEADGRVFLNRADGKYDFIFIDAYHGLRYIPPHLTTTEFFALCKSRLAEGGLVMMNIISGVTGERSELFQAFATTLQTAFPQVGAIPLSPSDPSAVQNIVLIAGEPGGFQIDGALIQQIPPHFKPMLLTDQRNPVETILARQLGFR